MQLAHLVLVCAGTGSRSPLDFRYGCRKMHLSYEYSSTSSSQPPLLSYIVVDVFVALMTRIAILPHVFCLSIPPIAKMVMSLQTSVAVIKLFGNMAYCMLSATMISTVSTTTTTVVLYFTSTVLILYVCSCIINSVVSTINTIINSTMILYCTVEQQSAEHLFAHSLRSSPSQDAPTI